MRRREFISLLGGAAAAWPLTGRAQQIERVRRVGTLFVFAADDPESRPRVTAIEDGLRKFGWIEGRNLHLECRWTAGNGKLAQDFAAEFANDKMDVIVATGTPNVRALQQATPSVPIVFVAISDPVGDGFVASLARPGGNITGFTSYEPGMVGKWLELLKEISPSITRVAVVFNPDTAPHALFLSTLQAAASTLAVQASPAHVRDRVEIEKAVAHAAQQKGSSLLALPDAFTSAHRDVLVAAAQRHAIPAIYPFTFYTRSGGLFSYGVHSLDLYERTSSYIDRILRGERAGDLPVQAPTKFELVINLNTAKALGLTVPPALLARADEVIE